MQPRTRQTGFSLIELLTVLLISGILFGIAVPAMGQFMDSNRMAAATNEFSTAIHLARSEAVKRRANVSMCASSDWSVETPSCSATGEIREGWIIFVDSTPPLAPNLNVPNAASVLYRHGPLQEGINLSLATTTAAIGGSEFISFASTGFPFSVLAGNDGAFNFQFCDHRGDKDIGQGIAAGRWVQVTTTGRPQLHRNRAEVEHVNNPTGGC